MRVTGEYGLNQYEVLGLDETASSRDIVNAYLKPRQVWVDRLWQAVERHGHDEDTQVVVQRCWDEAYRVLGDPALRAGYDSDLGYTRSDLAHRIGHRWDGWGLAWAFLFGFLALLFLLDHENISRMLGSHFAPSFTESEVQNEEGRWVGEFHSSDSRWEWVLNSWLLLSLCPAIMTGLVAWGGGVVLNRVAGEVIAWARYDGYHDTWVRVGFWLLAVLVPLAAWVQVWRYGLGSIPYT